MIYDEVEGLSSFAEFGLFRQVLQDPALITRPWSAMPSGAVGERVGGLRGRLAGTSWTVRPAVDRPAAVLTVIRPPGSPPVGDVALIAEARTLPLAGGVGHGGGDDG